MVEFYSISFRNLYHAGFPYMGSSFLQIKRKDLFVCCKIERAHCKVPTQPNVHLSVCSECFFVYPYTFLPLPWKVENVCMDYLLN